MVQVDGEAQRQSAQLHGLGAEFFGHQAFRNGGQGKPVLPDGTKITYDKNGGDHTYTITGYQRYDESTKKYAATTDHTNAGKIRATIKMKIGDTTVEVPDQILVQVCSKDGKPVKQKLVTDGLYEAFDLGCVWLEKMLVS